MTPPPLPHSIARVSVFRDDVIFVIYMVQRRMYAVDSSRPTEGFEDGPGAEGGEEEDTGSATEDASVGDSK